MTMEVRANRDAVDAAASRALASPHEDSVSPLAFG